MICFHIPSHKENGERNNLIFNKIDGISIYNNAFI